MNESKLSAEDLGAQIGVSGMTVRRWIEKPSEKPLPEIYERAIRDAVFKLVIEGKLDSDSKSVLKIFANPGDLMQRTAVKALGFPDNLDSGLSGQEDQIMSGLSHIGAMASRREQVERSKDKLPFYKRMGKEWAERINILTKVIASKNLTSLDKFPAYGALFYLLMTFDLIPDTIPVFGLMDDFSILGIAAAYYVGKQKNG